MSSTYDNLIQKIVVHHLQKLCNIFIIGSNIYVVLFFLNQSFILLNLSIKLLMKPLEIFITNEICLLFFLLGSILVNFQEARLSINEHVRGVLQIYCIVDVHAQF